MAANYGFRGIRYSSYLPRIKHPCRCRQSSFKWLLRCDVIGCALRCGAAVLCCAAPCCAVPVAQFYGADRSHFSAQH